MTPPSSCRKNASVAWSTKVRNRCSLTRNASSDRLRSVMSSTNPAMRTTFPVWSLIGKARLRTQRTVPNVLDPEDLVDLLGQIPEPLLGLAQRLLRPPPLLGDDPPLGPVQRFAQAADDHPDQHEYRQRDRGVEAFDLQGKARFGE